MANAIKLSAELVYDAAQELLSGIIGRDHFVVRAYSGGSRGHQAVTPHLAAKYLHREAGTLSSRLATTPQLEDTRGRYIQRGGTLPPGHYDCKYMADHPKFHGGCIRLSRQADAKAIRSPFSPHPIPHGRKDDFFIHGSAEKGSDGCIVLTNHAVRHQLNQAVKRFQGKVVLYVKNVSYLLPAELGGQIA